MSSWISPAVMELSVWAVQEVRCEYVSGNLRYVLDKHTRAYASHMSLPFKALSLEDKSLIPKMVLKTLWIVSSKTQK